MPKLPPFIIWFFISLVTISTLIAGFLGLLFTGLDEWRPITQVALDENPPKLWGPLFGQQTSPYKLGHIARLKPEILILGSSRGAQFREGMFPGAKVYNASLVATSLKDSVVLLDAILKIYTPRLIIFPIDTWWFNPNRPDQCNDGDECTIGRSFNVQDLVAAGVSALQTSSTLQEIIRTLWKQGWADPRKQHDPIGDRMPIGFLAQQAADGFRPDGSYQYGRMVMGDYSTASVRVDNADSYAYFIAQLQPSAANWQGNRFGTVKKIAERHIAALDRMLKLAQEHGIDVVLVLPPFAPFVMKLVDEYKQQSDFFSAITKVVVEAAQKYNFAVFDAHSMDAGLGDEHFYDGLHGDEHVHLALVQAIAKVKPLASFVDQGAIAALLALDKKRGYQGIWHHLIAR